MAPLNAQLEHTYLDRFLYLIAPRLLRPRRHIFFKTLFFLFGSAVSLSSGRSPRPSPIVWAYYFLIFEFGIIQSKLYINDCVGRDSDNRYFSRHSNAFPASTVGLRLYCFYTALRITISLAIAFASFGAVAGAVAATPIALQVVYEWAKRALGRTLLFRTTATFCIVCLGYAARVFAGMVAITGHGPGSLFDITILLWSTIISAVFLFSYWLHQSRYYIECIQVSPDVLERLKPGLAYLYYKYGHQQSAASCLAGPVKRMVIAAALLPIALLYNRGRDGDLMAPIIYVVCIAFTFASCSRLYSVPFLLGNHAKKRLRVCWLLLLVSGLYMTFIRAVSVPALLGVGAIIAGEAMGGREAGREAKEALR